MFPALFPEIHDKDALLADMDDSVLLGGAVSAIAIPLAYAFLPHEAAYESNTFLTVAFVASIWAHVIRILSKSAA
jgi:hypothetical protein